MWFRMRFIFLSVVFTPYNVMVYICLVRVSRKMSEVVSNMVN